MLGCTDGDGYSDGYSAEDRANEQKNIVFGTRGVLFSETVRNVYFLDERWMIYERQIDEEFQKISGWCGLSQPFHVSFVCLSKKVCSGANFLQPEPQLFIIYWQATFYFHLLCIIRMFF